MLLIAAAICGLNVLVGLTSWKMYPVGPGWFPVARETYPVAFWLILVVFLAAGLFLAGAHFGLVPGFSIASSRAAG